MQTKLLTAGCVPRGHNLSDWVSSAGLTHATWRKVPDVLDVSPQKSRLQWFGFRS